MGQLEEDKTIYSKLRELRRSRGMTVNTLAKKMGENYQKVGRIERGARTLTVDYLLKLSKALDTPMDTLMTEVQKKESEQNSSNPPVTDILNTIIVFVEEYQADVPDGLQPKQKAKIVSTIYQMTLKFPEKHQNLFLTCLFDTLKLISTSAAK